MKIKSIGLDNVRSVEWVDDTESLQLIDQRLIPFRVAFVQLTSVKDVCKSIKEMVVRGAPAIGATAAYGMVLAVKEANNTSKQNRKESFERNYNDILSTRPTAIDLSNFAKKIYNVALNTDFSFDESLKAAKISVDEMVEECRSIGERSTDYIEDGDSILTHCNAGPLATIDFGTALAPFFKAKEDGKEITVYVDETRPRLQGAKITAWELEQAEIEHKIIPDSAASFLMSQGKISKVILGADRCLKDGTVSNKIGTLSVAVNAKYFGIPFYSSFPWSTIDFESDSIEDFKIEYRDEKEVKYVTSYEEEMLIANPKSDALNPAFDITPPELITGYFTPDGVLSLNELNRKIQSFEKK
ncbi:MAG: S-methyl-5-thioribose-1-phosphate isomerase [Candidatus Heimdallarchaeaceae archaeon]